MPTYRDVLWSLANSIERHGFKRMLIVNGHGGNIAALAAILPDLQRQSSLKIRTTTYFELAQAAMPAILEDQDGVRHACEAETSMMMALAPELVRGEALKAAHGPPHVHQSAAGASANIGRFATLPRRVWWAMPGAPRARRVKS